MNVALGESFLLEEQFHITLLWLMQKVNLNPITSGLDAVSVTTTIFVRYELANGCFIVGQINVVINAMHSTTNSSFHNISLFWWEVL
ncbi:MAG: hypothetical protein IPJ39_14935 [Saprospiraceae bacterium]|nr:hypothetical protein [Saprospiraceae bacterium]